MKSKYVLIIAVVAFLFSILALCASYPAVESLQFDYLGLLVGILTVLVTTLLGWQIYNSISINQKINQLAGDYKVVSEKHSQVEDFIERNTFYFDGMISMTDTSSSFNHVIQQKEINIEELCNIYMCYLEALASLLASGDTKYPAFCLIQLDRVLGFIIKCKEEGQSVPQRFQEACDNFYQTALHPNIGVLGAGDAQLFFGVQARRKSIGKENPLPSAVNPWGLRWKKRF